MLYLLIDQGNTRVKYSLSRDEEWVALHNAQTCTETIVSGFLKKNRHSNEELAIIYSSVGKPHPETIAYLQQISRYYVFLDNQTPLPLRKVDYNREKIGADRIAVVVGASTLLKQKNRSKALVIDVGTAITYDYIDEVDCYLGGNIAPGPRIRFEALNSLTARLPLVLFQEREDIPEYGHDTEEAILCGVLNGITYELDGCIAQYKQNNHRAKVFLAGGHATFFASRIKSKIFVKPNLQMLGLRRILEYNIQIYHNEQV